MFALSNLLPLSGLLRSSMVFQSARIPDGSGEEQSDELTFITDLFTVGPEFNVNESIICVYISTYKY